MTVDFRWQLILKALRLKWARSLIIIGALAIGAAMVTAMAALYFDINEKMSRELRSFGANFYLGSANEASFKLADYEAIVAALPPQLFHAASPYLYGMARSEGEPLALVGVDFPALPPLVPYWQVEGAKKEKTSPNAILEKCSLWLALDLSNITLSKSRLLLDLAEIYL